MSTTSVIVVIGSIGGYLNLLNFEWELSDTFGNYLVMRSAERLLKRRESTVHQVLLHSDQGVQYSSSVFCKLFSEYNVIRSMSRTGNPRDCRYGELLGTF